MSRKFRVGGNKLFTDNHIFCICIATYYGLSVLNRVFASLFTESTGLAMILRLGTYGAVCIVLFGIIVSQRRLVALILLEVVVAIAFFLSTLTGELNDIAWENVCQIVATTYIPLAVAAYNVTDRKMLMKFIYPVAVASVPVLIAVSVLSYGDWDASYDMSLGYVMVFSVLVLLAQFTIDAKVHNLILAGLLSAFILFIGSRGPFICIIAFVLIELLLSERYSLKKRIATVVAILVILIVVLSNLDEILTCLYQFSVDLGFNSRSLLLLIQGEALSHDSGRNLLQDYYMESISKRPVLGYGVMGGWISDNMYPHNIVLELILAFGYPMGVLFSLILLFTVVRAVRRKSDKYSSALIILFVAYNTHLFVSESYLKVWQFFVCIALCLPNKRVILQKKEQLAR